MIGQFIPSDTPYTFLDYGVAAMAMIVLGIALWFVFRTQSRILTDHAKAMGELVESMRIMKEELLAAVVETRHLNTLTNREAGYVAEQQAARRAEHAAIMTRLDDLEKKP